ncbi:hypothetical protein IX51_10450 [uncultured archaeon]|nr:hypothetical protein IX51_10450 [uncultured archaeon]
MKESTLTSELAALAMMLSALVVVFEPLAEHGPAGAMPANSDGGDMTILVNRHHAAFQANQHHFLF